MSKRSPTGERLSYSSMNLIQGCQRKWMHYKVNKTAPDPTDETKNYFEVGSAFHLIQEMLFHNLDNLELSDNPMFSPTEKILDALTTEFKQMCIDEVGLNPEDWILVAALAYGYLVQVRESFPELKCISVEKEIYTEDYIGYADAIFINEALRLYYIIDLKTASRGLSEVAIKKLPKNVQLNLYAHPEYRKILKEKSDIADDFKFGGVGYFSAVKPKLSYLNKDTDQSYFEKLIGKTLNKANMDLLLIPATHLAPHKAYNLHKHLYSLSQNLRKGITPPLPNYNFCEAYFKPCEYFSQCHGEKCATKK